MNEFRFDINEVFEISNLLAFWVACKIFPQNADDIDDDFRKITMMEKFDDVPSQVHCLMIATKKRFDEIINKFVNDENYKSNCWEIINEYGDKK